MSDQKSYRSIMKATSIFGGIQVFQILITMIRGKFVAVLLGPAGMGITNLFMSSIDMVTRATGFGLSFSAIPDIAKAKGSRDDTALNKIVVVFKRLLLITGVLGTLCVLLLAPLLSKWTFGSNNYVVSYIFLSVVLVMGSFTTGYITILQGTQKVKLIAKITFLSSIIGLFISIPIYYFMGTSGIVPSIILIALSSLLVTYLLSKKEVALTSNVTWAETLHEGKPILGLGFLLSIGALLGSLVTYLLNLFISSKGSTVDVGLYQASITMTNQYVGLVFTAMSGDYLPRLSATINNLQKTKDIVNQQAEIALLIITPLLILLILCAPLLVKVLLTSAFNPIIPVIRWIALGTIFKAASFALGFITIAKGDKLLFFYLEGIVMNIIVLFLNVIFYRFWGLTGLGISFVIIYAISLFIYLILCRIRYKIYLSGVLLKLISSMMCAAFAVLYLVEHYSSIKSVVGAVIIAVIVSGMCLYLLEQRIALFSLLKMKMNRK